MRLLGMRASGMYRKGCKWDRKRDIKKAAKTKRPAQLRYSRWIGRHYKCSCHVMFLNKRIFIRDNKFHVDYTIPKERR